MQKEPDEVLAIDPDVNVFWTTPIKSIPNDKTADTNTGTIASLKNGKKPNSPILAPSLLHHFDPSVFQSHSSPTA